MHAADVVIYALALAGGAWVFAKIHREADRSDPLRLALAALVGVGAAFTIFETAALWLAQAADPWNAARLTPAIALHYGYDLYYPLNEGPVLSTVVGPMAFLPYWPIGFLRGTPTTLVLVGSLLNLLGCAWLLGTMVRRLSQAWPERLVLGLVAAQLALFFPSLRYSLFGLHADAPALLLGGLGAGFIIYSRADLEWPRCFAAAACLTLAVWAKQSLAPIFFGVVLVAGLHFGWRAAGRLVLASAATGVAVSAIFVGWLGYAALRDNMFVIPARHPWLQMNAITGEVSVARIALGASAKFTAFVGSTLHLLRENCLLFAILLAALGDTLLRARPGQRWPRSAWAAWFVVAVALVPMAAMGRVKIGGTINHESLTIFFLVAAFVCWLASLVQGPGRQLLARAGGLLALLLGVNAPLALDYPGWSAAWDNQTEAAYHYDLAHPGKIYFPWSPLSSLLAEGKLYHFDYGVYDRNLGRARVSPAHLAQNLPSPRPPIVSFAGQQDYILITYFPDYVLRNPGAKPSDWKIYAPP